MEYAAECFEQVFVFDKDVRRKVCRMIIEGGHLTTVSTHKFDIMGILSEFVEEPLEEVKPSVVVNVGLDLQQKAALQRAYPTLNVKVHDSVVMPHGMAYALRICDTELLLNELTFDIPDLIDIGGNYLAYAHRSFKFSVHCCTQKYHSSGLPDLREFHRQEQRDVLIRTGKQTVDYCTAGTETCYYHAVNSISVHTLPLIDPELIPTIFQNHGLQMHDAVFHYDTAMDTQATSGYIEGSGMNWRMVNGQVEFFFENDSSFPYMQSLEWTRRYARPGFFTREDWPDVVSLTVRSFVAGVMKIRMVRLDKRTIGYSSPHPMLRWVGGEDRTLVPVPVFRENFGFSINDPRAYEVVDYSIPTSLYEYVFMNCYANDTDRPDLPLSRADVMGHIRVFNAKRKLNGVVMTERHRIQQHHVADVATGIYLALVYKTARNRVVMSHFTRCMRSLQQRWGMGGVITLIKKSATATAILPYMALSKGLGEIVDLVTAQMRSSNFANSFFGLPRPQCPYVELPYQRYVGKATSELDVAVHSKSIDVPEADKKDFYFAVRDELPSDVREAIEMDLFNGEPPVPDVNPSLESQLVEKEEPEEEQGEQVVISQAGDFVDRAKWLDAFRGVQREAPDWAFNDEIRPEVGTHSQVTQYARSAILEYALHNIDVQYSTEKKVLEFMDVHWKGGSIDKHALKRDNDLKEIGAMFVTVRNGYLQDVADDFGYNMVVDPQTRKLLEVHKRAGGFFVGQVPLGVVYTMNSLRIANGYKLAKAALTVLREDPSFDDVRFELVDGIAGAGKTKALTQSFSRNQVFCTGPRLAAERVRTYLAGLKKFSSCSTEIERRVCTMDSGIINGFRGAQQLNIDEGLMMHSGSFYIAAWRTGAKRVLVSGDSEQIRLIDRGSGYGKLCYSEMRYWDSIVERNETERLPADATRLIRKFYPPERQVKIKTVSPIRRSMRFEHIPNPDDPRYLDAKPFQHFVSVTQGCKAANVSKPGFIDGKNAAIAGITETSAVRPVNTSHESQGDTYPVTIAFRRNKFSNAIFSSKPHRYVTVSRHTHVFVYRSVQGPANDALAGDVCEAELYTEEELDEVMLPPKPEVAKQRAEMTAKLQQFI